jgi:hypothetical protein
MSRKSFEDTSYAPSGLQSHSYALSTHDYPLLPLKRADMGGFASSQEPDGSRRRRWMAKLPGSRWTKYWMWFIVVAILIGLVIAIVLTGVLFLRSDKKAHRRGALDPENLNGKQVLY